MKRITICLALAALAFAQSNHSVTKADVDRDMKELSNWGRWGKDDQLGAFNLITDSIRKQAMAGVKEGVSVSLAHDLDKEKSLDNTTPFIQRMGPTGPATAGPWTVDSYNFPAYPIR